LASIEDFIRQLDKKLDSIGATDERVVLLRTIPGAGARLAEMVVAMIDYPKRFKMQCESPLTVV